MKARVSGFTLIRNGVKFDYPFVESLRSLLPLVDELVVNVGVGEDATLAAVREFAEREGGGKVRIFESHWPLDDPEKRRGGQILAEQTNLALDRCTGEWCIYLQADEVFHEADAAGLRAAMERFESDPGVEALVFQYVHLYGSFDVVQISRSAYRREVRAIKRSSGLRSIGDAQSFRKPDGAKPRAALIPARVFHYGWVRTPEAMKEKTVFMDSLYHGAKKAEAGAPVGGSERRPGASADASAGGRPGADIGAGSGAPSTAGAGSKNPEARGTDAGEISGASGTDFGKTSETLGTASSAGGSVSAGESAATPAAASTAATAASAATATGDAFLYKRFWGLYPYRGSHPIVMRERIARKNWPWDLQRSPWVFTASDVKKVVLDTVEKFTGRRFFEYRSYKIVREFS